MAVDQRAPTPYAIPITSAFVERRLASEATRGGAVVRADEPAEHAVAAICVRLARRFPTSTDRIFAKADLALGTFLVPNTPVVAFTVRPPALVAHAMWVLRAIGVASAFDVRLYVVGTQIRQIGFRARQFGRTDGLLASMDHAAQTSLVPARRRDVRYPIATWLRSDRTVGVSSSGARRRVLVSSDRSVILAQVCVEVCGGRSLNRARRVVQVTLATQDDEQRHAKESFRSHRADSMSIILDAAIEMGRRMSAPR